MSGVSCSPGGPCVAVEDGGFAFTSNPTSDPTWIKSEIDSQGDLKGISCPGSSLCVAVDRGGNVVVSYNPTAGAATWTRTNVDGSNALAAVSCPNASLCVAVDGDGNVVTGTGLH
jgi:hypothetical protein